MKFGMVLPNYGMAASKDILVKTALLAEEKNFDSLWVTDHIIVPKEFENPYGNLYEIFVTLGFISAITSKIKLGTSIMILPLREPNLVAKQISTLDTLSSGRIIFGVGGGWMEKEYDKIGIPFSQRGKIFDENIKLIRQFWKGEENFVSNPKPHNKKGPSIIIGGNSKIARKRAIQYGDGWFPVGLSPDELKISIKDFSILSNKKIPVYMRSLVEITEQPIGRYIC